MTITVESVLASAPPKIKRMPIDRQTQWAEIQVTIANREDIIARNAQRAEDAAAISAIKADNFVQSFIGMTPDKVSAYVDNNTATLAQTRVLLNKMALMLLALARREYR